MNMKKSLFSSYLAVFLLTMPAPLVSQAAEPGIIVLPQPWTLMQAVQYAKDNNPETHIAVKRMESAEATAKSIRSGHYPVVSLGAEYSQTNTPMYSFGNILNQGAFDETIDFNDPGRTDSLLMKGEVKYRIYDGGLVSSGTESALARSEAASKQLVAVHRQLGFEVVKSYHTILQTEEMVRVRTAAVDAISASVEVGRARYEAGDLLREDLLNLELQKARATEERIRSTHDRQLAEKVFWNLLGIESEVHLDLPSNDTEQKAPQSTDYLGRSELAAMDAMILAAQEELEVTRSGGRPQVDAFASYQVDHGTVLGETGDSWMAGLRMNYTLYDGSRTKADTVSAKARLMEARAEKEKLKLALSLELQQARINHEQSLERLQVTEKMVEVAHESAELSRIRFQEGVILASDLIDMEMRLTDAQARRAAATADHDIAVANLRRTAGIAQFTVPVNQ